MTSRALRFIAPPLLLAVASGESVAAQQALPEVVRGRVIDDSSRAVRGAVVSVTRGPDRLVQQTTTDTAGRYSIGFDPGTGDYLVHVAAPGFNSVRRRVQQPANARELIADFTVRPLAMLAPVKTIAVRPVRASSAVVQGEPGTGSSERWADGANGQVPPTVAGDIGALVGTIPGVIVTPGGFSMLGAGAESNLTTMNGFELPVGSLPRAAQTEARVSGAPYDATRGGFAGANVDIRLAAGNRNYQVRSGSLTIDPPQFQLTDAVSRSLGAKSGTVRGSIGANGELIRRRLLYNVAVDANYNGNQPATLLDASPTALASAGLSSDSAARLLSLASALGVPTQSTAIPDARRLQTFSWLGRLDEVADSLRTITLTSYANVTREGALGLSALAGPSTSARRRSSVYGGQLAYTRLVGPGHRIVMQNKVAASRTDINSAPYLTLPAAVVLVRSPARTDDDAGAGLASVNLGGSSWPVQTERRWLFEGANDSYWNARGREHRFHEQLWGRMEGIALDGISNPYGRYFYNSPADFAENRPSSYTRTLVQPARDGRTWNSALAVSDEWTKSRTLSLIFGLRGEASGYFDAPARNPALESAIGVRTGIAPSRVHVSPRAGFTYVYHTDRSSGTSSFLNPVGRFTRNQFGVLRGGIGEFRDLLRPNLLADARASTGLPGGTLQLQCVGSAIPPPDWSLMSAGGPAPSDCTGGDQQLQQRAPYVSLLDPSFDVPRAWRASLNWMTAVRRVTVRVDALGSRSLSNGSTVDANFLGIERFTLPEEAGRPVFVPLTSIDPATGTLAAAVARKSPEFGTVAIRQSDLAGEAGQLTVSLAPDLSRFRSRISLSGALSYTLQGSREQFRGFDGAAFGDPRVREWSAGANDVRHAVVLQGGMYHRRVGAITTFLRIQSGIPFTPLVLGDINGDGRANDRALVPSVNGVDRQLSAQMQSLLNSAPQNVRNCLRPMMGNVAERNSCRGPWTQALNLQWSPPVSRTVLGRRVAGNVYFQNPLGGIDQLLHGQAKLRGWGAQTFPDQTLLVPRSFDASARRFQYDVNPRFGDTRAFRSINRAPFRIALDFSVDLSTPYDVQSLRRALEPVKEFGTWTRRSADSIASFYLRQRAMDLYRLILSESDSLLLTRDQISRLQNGDTNYVRRVRALYRPLGTFLANQPENRVGQAALDTVKVTGEMQQLLFWESVDSVSAILNPGQREMLPNVRQMIALAPDQRKTWSFSFQYTVPLFDRPVPVRP